MKFNLTMDLVRAASWDAANRNMQQNNRKIWNKDDWNAMCDEQNRLLNGMVPVHTLNGIKFLPKEFRNLNVEKI